RSWAERIRIGGEEADFEEATSRVRPAAQDLGATQFEALTAAALAAFADAGVNVAVVEAGLGGRLDATNVLRAPVVVLTNVGLEERGESPFEVWDGAHNLDGVLHLLARVPTRDYVLVVSILEDKDVDGMLAALAVLGGRLVATTSSNTRALPAGELGRHAIA